VTEAIYGAGFNSNGRFYAESSQMLGMTPRNFRRGGKGEAIRFAVGECSLGSILVAASEKGVCAISLGNDPDPLVRALQDQFPKARLAHNVENAYSGETQLYSTIRERPAWHLNRGLSILL